MTKINEIPAQDLHECSSVQDRGYIAYYIPLPSLGWIKPDAATHHGDKGICN